MFHLVHSNLSGSALLKHRDAGKEILTRGHHLLFALLQTEADATVRKSKKIYINKEGRKPVSGLLHFKDNGKTTN